MTEVWVTCRRNDAYEVSSAGRVQRRSTQRVLKAAQNSKQGRPGYFKVSLGRNMRNCYVHQLVAEAFLGERPVGHDVDHIRHDRLDNSVGNLRYAPSLDNAFRWAGRTEAGRILWNSPYLDEQRAPEGHEPLTEQERDAIFRAFEAHGW